MADTHETIADIIAEKRRQADKIERVCAEKMKHSKMVSDCARELVADIRREADRLEAALKREKTAIEADALTVGGIVEAQRKRERGDSAKLREALEAIISGYENADLCDMNYREWCHNPENVCVNVLLCKAIHEARAALSAPPRNCDRPECATTKSAQEVWRKEDGGRTAYYEWLLATANAAVSIIGRESINKQCYECANCKEPTAGWDGSKFRCAFLSKDFDTWHYDVPNECPCKGNGWAPKEKEGGAK